MAEDLVEQLKEMHQLLPALDRLYPDPDGPSVSDVVRQAAIRIAALEAEVARLREALKPFADEAATWPALSLESEKFASLAPYEDGTAYEATFSMADIARAAQALGDGG